MHERKEKILQKKDGAFAPAGQDEAVAVKDGLCMESRLLTAAVNLLLLQPIADRLYGARFQKLQGGEMAAQQMGDGAMPSMQDSDWKLEKYSRTFFSQNYGSTLF